MQKALQLLFYLAIPAFGLAQYPFEFPVRLTEEDGLLNDYVTAVEEDSEGFLWVGTYLGLCRFDGTRFQTLSKPNMEGIHTNLIFDLRRDRRGQMWVSSAAGITVYKAGSLQAEKVPSDIKSDQPGGTWFNTIYEDRQGILWAGSNIGGIYQLDTVKNIFHAHPFYLENEQAKRAVNHVYSISQDIENDSILWVGTRGGLIRFNKYSKDFAWFPFEMKVKEKNADYASANEVLSHSDGNVYIGCWGGILTFNTHTNTFQLIFEIKEAFGPREFTFKKINEKELWLTNNKGLIIYNTDLQKVTKIYHNNLKDNLIYGATHIDRQGRIWVRSPLGLHLYNPILQQFKTYNNPFVATKDYVNFTRGLLESADGQILYVCGAEGKGISVFNRRDETWRLLSPPAGAPQDGTFRILDILRLQDGRVLVLSPEKLYLLQEKAQKLEPVPLKTFSADIAPQNMIQDRSGNLWMSTKRSGLLCLNPQNWEITNYKEQLHTKGVTERYSWMDGLHEDRQGNIWMHANPGFCVYDVRRDTLLNFLNEDEISFSFVQDNQGFVWVSVFNQGLYQYDPQHLEKGIIKKYTIKEGLIDYPLRSIKDRKGIIWIEHGKGITAFDPGRKTFRHLGKAYNFPNDHNNEKLCVLSNGEIVFSTQAGICIFNPETIEMNTELPLPYLTSFRIFDQEIEPDSSNFNPKRWNLSYQQNFFSFEFSAVAYNIPEGVKFAYQLVGVDKDWVQAGTRRFAAYTNIPGGSYTFRVKAANSEGVWNTVHASIQIHISTPWWRTWWFFVLLGLGLGGAIFVFYTLRIREFRKQEQLKIEFERKLADVKMNALRAQINPHFIFNCLNSIDYYIIKNESQKASEYLNQFSRLIRLILQNSSANFVLLKDELEALQLYMRMESMRFNQRFDYEVKIEKNLDTENLEIPPMLLQPYVENAIWHGLMPKPEKGAIQVAITRENGYLHCTIEDNGIGREKAEQTKTSNHSTKKRSMGMAITQNRIELLNQQLGKNTTVNIIDLKDGNNKAIGTKVELNIPINE